MTTVQPTKPSAPTLAPTARKVQAPPPAAPRMAGDSHVPGQAGLKAANTG
jgi:hypothetical protein